MPVAQGSCRLFEVEVSLVGKLKSGRFRVSGLLGHAPHSLSFRVGEIQLKRLFAGVLVDLLIQCCPESVPTRGLVHVLDVCFSCTSVYFNRQQLQSLVV